MLRIRAFSVVVTGVILIAAIAPVRAQSCEPGLGFPEPPRFAVASPHSVIGADLNLDGRLDLATANQSSNDVSVLLSSLDCNENGIADRCDIRDGRSADCNQNSIPDECEEVVITCVIPATDPCSRSGGPTPEAFHWQTFIANRRATY